MCSETSGVAQVQQEDYLGPVYTRLHTTPGYTTPPSCTVTHMQQDVTGQRYRTGAGRTSLGRVTRFPEEKETTLGRAVLTRERKDHSGQGCLNPRERRIPGYSTSGVLGPVLHHFCHIPLKSWSRTGSDSSLS